MRDFDPREYAPNSYLHEAGTALVATNCIMCGLPLRDPESLDRGVGPICAKKHGIFTETGGVDEEALAAALETAPGPLRAAVEARRSDPRAALSAAIHAAGNAWEQKASDWGFYVGSTMEIATALGYGRTALALQRRCIEGWKYDEEGNRIGDARPKGIVVSDHGGGQWKIELPYIDNRSVFFDTIGALKGAGVRARNLGGNQWERIFAGTDRQWLLVVNALVPTLAGTLGVLPNGETFVVPKAKVAVPAPEGPAAGAPVEVKPVPAEPELELKEGDTVELNDGRTMVIARMGTNSKGRWLGLMTPADARKSQEKFGYLWFSKFNAGFIGLGDVKTKVATQAEVAEVEETTDTAVSGPAKEREIPTALLPWQREGVLWLDQKGSGILAFEQGTGKTPTALAALDAPAVIIVPASLRENWRREANKWRPDLVVAKIESAADLDESALKATCIIIGYEGAAKADVLEKLIRYRPRTLIVDEAQAAKELVIYQNKKTGGLFPGKQSPQRAVAMYELAKVAKRRFFLSGTPMVNGRPYELWPLLHMVDPKEWRSQPDYWDRYCEAHEVNIGGGKTALNVKGHDNLPELRDRIHGHFLLRKSKDVLNLPPKVREYKAIGMVEEVAEQYRQAALEFLAWVRRMGGPEAAMRARRAEAIAKLTALKRLCGIGKAPIVVEAAADFLRDEQRPLIVMGHHEEALETIQTALESLGYRVGTITGKVTGKARERAVDEFQQGWPLTKPIEKRKFTDVLVCSITAAGVGLTLTRAQDMFIMERVWRPFDLVQAEDRIHRYGQANKCTITYFDAAGTIDDKLAALLAEKAATAAEVIDGVDLEEDEAAETVMRDMFSALVSKMTPNASEADWDALGGEADWANPEIG